MSGTRTSTLQIQKFNKGPKVMLLVETKSGPQWMPATGQLSSELAALEAKSIADLDGVEVEYEFEGGKPRRIRRKGEAWQAAAPAPDKRSGSNRPSRGGLGPKGSSEKGGGPSASAGSGCDPGAFHNPYNFVPSLPRGNVTNELGDHPPCGHFRYHAGRWAGTLTLRLTTETPLLIPDASRSTVDGRDHRTFGLRKTADGAPLLPVTSVKGMLRSAYEAVTNSRMAVFAGHEERLAYRMEARAGLGLVPVLIEEREGQLVARLALGDGRVGPNGKPQGPQYAAWLPRYRGYRGNAPAQKDKGERSAALRYPDNSLPRHGDAVWVRVEPETHPRRGFQYVKVTAIRPRRVGDAVPDRFRAGVVCLTGRNIMNKHDERVFLLGDRDPSAPLSQDHVAQWQELIRDYAAKHADEIKKRERDKKKPDDYLGHEPGHTGFSRHVYTKGADALAAGTLCYARVESTGGSYRVGTLYPVMIARDLFEATPDALLDVSLKPAVRREALSPADRVFGWVGQQGKGAWRGQLRVGPITCDQGRDAIERLNGGQGATLAILGQPKPEQARFYLSADRSGNTPYDPNLAKGDGYRTGQGLRGRKVYPHHDHLEAVDRYWEPSLGDRPQSADGRPLFPEFLRNEGERDNQNRTVTEWVRPGTAFRFEVDVQNLSDVELGALLWMLRLPGYHRLGGGKPLGFGSVRLSLDGLDLRNGEAMAAYYRDLAGESDSGRRIDDAGGDAVAGLVEAYQTAVEQAYGTTFEHTPFVAAFKQAIKGFGTGLPVHYPRCSVEPEARAENFKWFEANERGEDKRCPLPLMQEDRGLPMHPEHNPPARGHVR